MTSYTEVLYSTTVHTTQTSDWSIQAHVLSGYKLPGGIGGTNVKFRRLSKHRRTLLAFTSIFQWILMSANFSTTKRTELRKSEIFADTLYNHMFTSCSISNVYNITF